MPARRSLLAIDHFAPVDDLAVLRDVRVADRHGVLEAEKAERLVGSDEIVVVDADFETRISQGDTGYVEGDLFVPLRMDSVAFDTGLLAFDFVRLAELQGETNDGI